MSRACFADGDRVRAWHVLGSVGAGLDARQACLVARVLRHAAGVLHDGFPGGAGEYAGLREGRFGRRGVL